MNNKIAKKIRKQVRVMVKTDTGVLTQVLAGANLWWRFRFAIRIILKFKPEAML